MKKREVQKRCAFYAERKTKRKHKDYTYSKCKLTKDSCCICEYKRCTLYIEKEEYIKNCKKYPIMTHYGEYHGTN